MDLGIKGKRALVCASSKGLGRGCAEKLAEAGVDLVLNARGAEAVEETAEAIRAATGVSVETVAADVTTPEGQTAVIAAAGFAIGLALSGLLGNFSAGIMLLIFRPFKVGDVVNAGGITGKVEAIELFTTVFDTPDNRRIVVPNGTIFGGNIETITFHPTRRVDVAVGTDYPADIDEARRVLEKVAAEVDRS